MPGPFHLVQQNHQNILSLHFLFEESVSSKELGEPLLRLLQLTKDISVCLKEPSRRPRSTLTIKDVKLTDSQEDLSSLPLWRTGLAETNRLMLNALAELLNDREAQQQRHLNMMVDTFAEELDQIRQSEELGPSKLELLIESLKTGSLLNQ